MTVSGAVVSVKLDRDAGAAYLRLGTSGVSRTVEFSEDIFVDLDAMDVVVGVELLDLISSIPIDELASRFHIHSESLRILSAAIDAGLLDTTVAFADANRPSAVPFGTVTNRPEAARLPRRAST